MTGAAAPPFLMHASCVDVAGRGLLILGPSGAGKSSLALQMIALGAALVSDDQTELAAENGRLVARAPASIAGLIEARFVGLLHMPAVEQAEIHLVVDLSRSETARLPEKHTITLGGIACALAYSSPAPHFASALICLLKHGRSA